MIKNIKYISVYDNFIYYIYIYLFICMFENNDFLHKICIYLCIRNCIHSIFIYILNTLHIFQKNNK